MPRETIQKKLERVRPPRVHISYDVTSGGAIELRELPFVIGVLGDFAGASQKRLRWKERTFREITWDNFNEVLAEVEPRVQFTIPSSLSDGGLDIDLSFHSIEDFEPANVALQIGPLEVLRQSDSLEARETLRRHLDRVLHAPEFQSVEAGWRGLWYLLSRTESSSELKIKMINVSKQELLQDLQRAAEFDQTALFEKVYEEPYVGPATEPFGLLIGDYTFTQAGEDIELLSGLGEIASTSLAPFISAAGPEMFGIRSFARLPQVSEPARVFDSTEYAKWRRFRESEDSRYVGLTLPRILLRSPYGCRPEAPGQDEHEEDTHGGRYLLWGNAAYAFATCIANAFTRYGWCGAIKGVEGGGLVEGLPTWVQEADGEAKVRSGVEVSITDRDEIELSNLGFMALVKSVGTDYATFFSVPSCMQPKRYDNEVATANSRTSCQLQHVLAASRFMHYIKVIAHERSGSAHTRGDWEQLLNSWISHYVLLDDQASPVVKARRPLREARIEVSEVPAKPGVYRAVVFLRPHFQLDELSTSLRFVVKLN